MIDSRGRATGSDACKGRGLLIHHRSAVGTFCLLVGLAASSGAQVLPSSFLAEEKELVAEVLEDHAQTLLDGEVSGDVPQDPTLAHLSSALRAFREGDYAAATLSARQLLQTEEIAAEAMREEKVLVQVLLAFSLLLGDSLDSSLLDEAETIFRDAAAGEGRGAALAAIGQAMALWGLGETAEAAVVARQALGKEQDEAISDLTRTLACQLRFADRTGSSSGGEGESAANDLRSSLSQQTRMKQAPDAVTAPVKIYFPPPPYTEVARRARIEGRVTLITMIDKLGCVQNAEIREGLPNGLNWAALSSVSRWVFRPATLDGEPVPVYYQITIQFRLESSPAENG